MGSETYLIVRKCIGVLPKSDTRKYLMVVLLHIVLGFLDLIGVAILGLVGSIAINGISFQKPGNRIGKVLEILQLETLNLQTQVTILGFMAIFFLVTKSLLSLFLGKKILFFLSFRSAALSSQLVQKLFSKDITLVEKDSITSRIYILTSGVDAITTGVLGSIALMLADAALLIILSTGLFIVDFWLAILCLIYFSSMGIMLYQKMHHKVRSLGMDVTKFTVQGNQGISEIVTSYREILIRDRRAYYSDQIRLARYKAVNASAEITYMNNYSKYMMELFMIIGGLGIAAFEFFYQSTSKAIAIISIFLATSSRIAPGILRIQQGILNMKSKIATSATTFKLIQELEDFDSDQNIETEIISKRLNTNHKDFDPKLKISKLGFIYPGANIKSVSNFDIEIAKGESVAIVGPSGAGKSTLVDLILGVLTPTEGTVLLSGEKPSSAIRKWPGALGYVPQQISINQGTIKSNICLGYAAEDIDDAHIWAVLKSAQIDDFVQTLPNGIHTKIEDRGSNLSGGQRQRLGIARALFTNPKLIVLDEATSALDAETEKRVNECIQNLHGSVTVISIAHRLSTVVNADRVIYMEKGEVLAEGSFSEVRSQIHDFDYQAKLLGL